MKEGHLRGNNQARSWKYMDRTRTYRVTADSVSRESQDLRIKESRQNSCQKLNGAEFLNLAAQKNNPKLFRIGMLRPHT